MVTVKTNTNPKLHKWVSWIDAIHKDVQFLLESQVIYRGYLDIIKANATIQSPPDFHHWARRNYATFVAMSIRRQMDTDRDVISLKRLLEEIAQCPNLITKTWYQSLYKPEQQAFAEGDFESLAGKGTCFDGNIALSDIKMLEQLGDKIKNYASRRIAHNSSRRVKDLPDYNDVDSFIEELEKIVRKYVQLFTGSGYTSLVPTWQYDWTDVFRKPWIK